MAGMSDLLWFLTRASGIVALVLMLAAVVDGLVFSARLGGPRVRPAWLMDLHRGLGGYALMFTGLHLATAFGAGVGVGLASIFVPGIAPADTTAYTLGVVAFYVMAVTVFTTWPKRLLRRKVWHLLHILSVPATLVAAVHAYQLGSDASQPVYLGLSAVAAGLFVYPLVMRLIGTTASPRRRSSVRELPARGAATPARSAA